MTIRYLHTLNLELLQFSLSDDLICYFSCNWHIIFYFLICNASAMSDQCDYSIWLSFIFFVISHYSSLSLNAACISSVCCEWERETAYMETYLSEIGRQRHKRPKPFAYVFISASSVNIFLFKISWEKKAAYCWHASCVCEGNHWMLMHMALFRWLKHSNTFNCTNNAKSMLLLSPPKIRGFTSQWDAKKSQNISITCDSNRIH